MRGLVFEAAVLPTVLSLVPIQTQILTQLQNVVTGAGLMCCVGSMLEALCHSRTGREGGAMQGKGQGKPRPLLPKQLTCFFILR